MNQSIPIIKVAWEGSLDHDWDYSYKKLRLFFSLGMCVDILSEQLQNIQDYLVKSSVTISAMHLLYLLHLFVLSVICIGLIL